MEVGILQQGKRGTSAKHKELYKEIVSVCMRVYACVFVCVCGVYLAFHLVACAMSA